MNAVAVSEQTFRVTERVFDYEPLEPVSVKGKAAPLALYRPLVARARFGSEVTRTHATPLVGRELEKPLLIGTFERAAQQRACQLVTVVGEPGVGKSRLCMELFSYIEERPGLVRWRQGRCLPYGEGIAFWALGEIVKAECGILEAIAELNDADPALSLQVRVGINTGEAVVALGARPEEGEGIVTGDVVNTASRLRLLPTPGSPTTVTSWHEVCCAARSNVPIRSGFSNSLPTNAVACERATSEPKRARATNGR